MTKRTQRQRNTLVATAITTVLISSTLSADETTALPTLVITGTGTEKSLPESPIPIEVIDQQQIREQGATRLDDLLKSVPGLQLMDQHGQQGQTVMMQGMNPEHVLILIDGVPTRQTNSEFNVERIDLSRIQRVEIVPGNSSSLYGSSAMGGVINLITNDEKTPYLSSEIGATQTESDTTKGPTELNANVQTGYALGDGFAEQGLSLTRYSGVDINPDRYGANLASGYRWTLSGDYQWEDFQSNLTWMGGRLERPYLQIKANNEFKRIKTENSDELSASLRRSTTTSEQIIQVDGDRYDTRQAVVGADDYYDLTRQAISLAPRLSHQQTLFTDHHDLTLGLVASMEFLEQTKTEQGETTNEISRKHRSALEVFAQDDWYTTDSLETITGLRAQWDSDFGFFLSPKLALRWDLQNSHNMGTYLRASTGLGYRVPDLKERHYRFDHEQYGYELIGSPELEPETALGSQIELGGHFSVAAQKANWSVTAFRQDVRNLIDTELNEDIDNGIDTFQYTNLGQARIQGVETQMNLLLSLGSWNLNNRLSAQVLEARDTSNDQDLINRPDLSVQFSQKLSLPNWHDTVLSHQVRYVGEQILGGESRPVASPYLLVDLAAQFSITDHWRLHLSVDNLTNNHNNEQDDDARPVLGRTWSMAIRYQ
ncbi:TonB-dependent receptor plug domain-containing protein [Reinekea blandensis]|uniref:Outer membrane receptor for ferrienterochelin and colicins n=1 Tax=Reinekea blandensis MED297 TaxID=314283 RepID=A4BG04_9GAMM|nr:TonB-dependent receptor [Reinekea blandensis]EAR09022.1 Outer membrane receptor for ferrienterochelin and colicins [Reinekea sp. MED297] [Reinekea blandensis MED297]